MTDNPEMTVPFEITPELRMTLTQNREYGDQFGLAIVEEEYELAALLLAGHDQLDPHNTVLTVQQVNHLLDILKSWEGSMQVESAIDRLAGLCDYCANCGAFRPFFRPLRASDTGLRYAHHSHVCRGCWLDACAEGQPMLISTRKVLIETMHAYPRAYLSLGEVCHLTFPGAKAHWPVIMLEPMIWHIRRGLDHAFYIWALDTHPHYKLVPDFAPARGYPRFALRKHAKYKSFPGSVYIQYEVDDTWHYLCSPFDWETSEEALGGTKLHIQQEESHGSPDQSEL